MHQWDATSLITCAKFQIGNRLVCVAVGIYDATMGQQLLLVVRPRLHVGLVEYSLRRLEGVV